MSYSNIMIPVDGSEYSKFACNVAYELAKAVPGEEIMHLVHCMDPIPNLIGGEARQKLLKDHEETAKELFAPYTELFFKLGNKSTTTVLYGEPGEAIARAAEDMNCDLIIMGSRGLNALKTLVLGSVSQSVLQRAKVPVLLATIPRKD